MSNSYSGDETLQSLESSLEEFIKTSGQVPSPDSISPIYFDEFEAVPFHTTTKPNTEDPRCTLEELLSLAPSTSHHTSRALVLNRRVWFETRSPHSTYVEKEEELRSIKTLIVDNDSNPDQINTTRYIAICGHNGIGKTEFVRSLARSLKTHHVIWLEAEDRSKLALSFTRLAEYLGRIPTNDKSATQIAQRCYEHFQSQKSIFIFDNAEAYSGEDVGIEEFLPHFVDPTWTPLPNIVVTSTSSKWPTFHVLRMGLLTPEEGLKYCQLVFGNLANKEVYAEFLEELGYFPQFLQQATAYIQKLQKSYAFSSITPPCPITEYLKLIRDEGPSNARIQEMLSYVFDADLGTKYPRIFWKSWKLTTVQLQKSPLAVEIISVISFLCADRIPAFLFVSGRPENLERDFENRNAIQNLLSHCLLTLESGFLSIHRLPQKVIRLQLGPEMERVVLTKAMTLLQPFLNQAGIDLNKTKVAHLCIEHARNVCTHILTRKWYDDSEFSNFILNVAKTMLRLGLYANGTQFTQKALTLMRPELGDDEILYLLEEELGNLLFYLGKRGSAVQIFEKLYETYEFLYGVIDARTLKIANRWANALNHFSKTFKKALKIYTTTFDRCSDSHSIIALTAKSGAANCKKCIGEFDIAQTEFESIIKTIQDEIISNPNPELEELLGVSQFRLALVYRELGNFEKAAKLFREFGKLSKRRKGLEHPTTLKSYIDLIECLIGMKQFERAEMKIIKIYEKSEEALTENHLSFFQLREQRAVVQLNLGQVTQDYVKSEHEDMLKRKRDMMKLDPIACVHNEKKIAVILFDTGEVNDALDLFKKVLKTQRCVWTEDHRDVQITTEMIRKCEHELLKQKYGCTYEGCSKRYVKESILNRHIIQVHLGVKFSCEFCNKEFSRQDILRVHQRKCKEKIEEARRHSMLSGELENI